jgi:hypothetical protein
MRMRASGRRCQARYRRPSDNDASVSDASTIRRLGVQALPRDARSRAELAKVEKQTKGIVEAIKEGMLQRTMIGAIAGNRPAFAFRADAESILDRSAV